MTGSTRAAVAAALTILFLCSLHILKNLPILAFKLDNKGTCPDKAVMISQCDCEIPQRFFIKTTAVLSEQLTL